MSALLEMIRARKAELASQAELDPWQPGPDGRVPCMLIDSADLGLSWADVASDAIGLTETGTGFGIASHPLVEAEIAGFRQRERIAAHRAVVVRVVLPSPERP